VTIDFAGKRLWFFLFSALVIAAGIVFLVIAPGLKLGIDFTGGTSLTVQFSGEVDQQRLRDEFGRIGHPEVTVQNLGENTYFVRTRPVSEAERAAMIDGLEVAFAPLSVDPLAFDLVSPVVAGETVRNGLYAVIAAALGIFVYLWWAFKTVPNPFRYGVAAVIALVHDAVVVVGVFAFLGMVFGIEVNTMFLIALLTVIGYSVNDTIVVFDRLRENVLASPSRRFRDQVNISVSETLSRSLNTSLTVLIVLFAMYLFGGATIQSFLLVLLIGVIAGTYSSIGIAASVLVSWQEGDVPRLFRKVRGRGSPEPQAA
jgi:preprotein translocase subunit SecF